MYLTLSEIEAPGAGLCCDQLRWQVTSLGNGHWRLETAHTSPLLLCSVPESTPGYFPAPHCSYLLLGVTSSRGQAAPECDQATASLRSTALVAEM